MPVTKTYLCPSRLNFLPIYNLSSMFGKCTTEFPRGDSLRNHCQRFQATVRRLQLVLGRLYASHMLGQVQPDANQIN